MTRIKIVKTVPVEKKHGIKIGNEYETIPGHEFVGTGKGRGQVLRVIMSKADEPGGIQRVEARQISN